jgi:hypothetical protein
MGAISALGGGGDLGISVDDAEVGGDVVILRSELDMLFFVSRQCLVMRYISEGFDCARLIEQEENRNRIQAINH